MSTQPAPGAAPRQSAHRYAADHGEAALQGAQRPRALTFIALAGMLIGLAGTLLMLTIFLDGPFARALAGDRVFSDHARLVRQLTAGISSVIFLGTFAAGIGQLMVGRWARPFSIVVACAALVFDLIVVGVALSVFQNTFLVLPMTLAAMHAMLSLSVMFRREVICAFLQVEPGSPEEPERSAIREWLASTPGWASSMLVHAAAIVVLGVITLEPEKQPTAPSLTALKREVVEDPVEELFEPEPDELDLQFETSALEQVELEVDEVDITDAFDEPAPLASVEVVDISPLELNVSETMTDMAGAIEGASGFGGRGGALRKRLVAMRGGSQQSEDAVARALRWLARHQLPDGSWDFNHQGGQCQGRCADPGQASAAKNAATAMGLLPFLGAGQTHYDGAYQNVVGSGLAYLVRSMKVDRNGGSLVDAGSFYSHGLASIALCEAYAMTQDASLMVPCQKTLDFIVYAQDERGGGWRYAAGQAGDTSVVGWQLMALKSGHLAYLHIPPNVIAGAENFLNTVQLDDGALYGYVGPEFRASTTAIGLLMRMYLGWEHDVPALRRGVERLSEIGPSNTDMYYNYYATQVLAHYDGELWEAWNSRMRDYLVEQQVRDDENHADGSWHFTATHTEQGGRLYNTSLATMILEVYYRHLPLYGETATEDFP